MKYRLMFTFFALSLMQNVIAQDDKKFNFGVSFGYVSTTDNADGAVIHLEPGYVLNERLSVGMRIEWALMGKVIEGLETSVDGGDKSVTFNATTYFPGDRFRFFAGVGLGVYHIARVAHPVAGFGTVDSKLFMGGYPRVGIQYGRFNLMAEYNIVPRSRENLFVEELSLFRAPFSREVEINNSYFALKASIIIGRDL